MATASSTHPPTSYEAASEARGEAIGGLPGSDLPSWEIFLSEEKPAEPTPEQLTPTAVEQEPPSATTAPGEFTDLPGTPSPPGAVTPPPGTPLPVLLLVDQAWSAMGEERQELSRRINRLLDQMVREGGSRHVADWLHHLIDSRRLEGLEDAAGHACHEMALRGLISMGFPYALEIRPEDLASLRPQEGEPRSRPRIIKPAAAAVVIGGSLGQLLSNVMGSKPISGLLMLEVGVLLLALVGLLASAPRTPLRYMALAVTLVASLLSIFLGLLPGYAGLVSGLAGVVAALLFAFRES